MHALPQRRILQIVPDGCIDIIWTGESLRVAGPDTGPVFESFPADTVILGLRFRPGAAPPWLGLPASEIANARLPLEDLWGARTQRWTDRLHAAAGTLDVLFRMQAMLLARRPDPPPVDRVARGVLLAASDGDTPMNVLDLARRLDLSARSLRRRCHNAFGYGPKTLARILRFQRFLRLLRGDRRPRLAEVAAESGFADQAHMSREVRRLSGLAPSRFLGGGQGSPGTP
jgi:AraC-like DNA-binding protein